MPCQQKNGSVCFVLIHNNVARRYNYIRPALETLSESISKNYVVNLEEVSYRPAIVPHSALMLFRRDIMQWTLNRAWNRYCLLKRRPFLIDLLSFLKISVKTYLSPAGRSALAGKKRNSYREMVITANHILAWRTFLKSGADYLVCFEDDVIFREDSIQRMNELLDILFKNREQWVYADLAGGFGIDALEVDTLEIRCEGSFRYYRRPVTNTACCYLLSRSLADFFITSVNGSDSLRLYKSDWLVNKLFIRGGHDGIVCLCMHAFPTIFRHGSFTGEYPSLLSPDRQG